tara:strand:- start:407 stop:760 length:354 start_codon:yes stop_codon:yes gene_type:complete
MRNKNPFGKSTKPENAYATYKVVTSLCGMYFEWRVLKTYQTKTNEDKNQYARWYCAVKSPMTHDQWEYGDTYIKDIMSVGTKLVSSTGLWREHYNDDLLYNVADNLKRVGLNVITFE